MSHHGDRRRDAGGLHGRCQPRLPAMANRAGAKASLAIGAALAISRRWPLAHNRQSARRCGLAGAAPDVDPIRRWAGGGSAMKDRLSGQPWPALGRSGRRSAGPAARVRSRGRT